MKSTPLGLKEFINVITMGTMLHVCIHDLSGILTISQFELDYINTIHYTEVCNFAKTTKSGLKLCMKCKLLANKKAVTEQKPFKGICPLGVTEYVYPVVIDDTVVCIIYLGNICEDITKTQENMKHVCKITGIKNSVINPIYSMDNNKDTDRYRHIAEAIQSYITLMYIHADIKVDKRVHWAVQSFANYADTFFNKDITIVDLAKLYNINEKYAGRLFKNQMKMSFNEYLNSRRIDAAKKMLRDTDMRVTEIAMECGYNNITYFNRIFKSLTRMTPKEYRTTISVNFKHTS